MHWNVSSLIFFPTKYVTCLFIFHFVHCVFYSFHKLQSSSLIIFSQKNKGTNKGNFPNIREHLLASLFFREAGGTAVSQTAVIFDADRERYILSLHIPYITELAQPVGMQRNNHTMHTAAIQCALIQWFPKCCVATHHPRKHWLLPL